MRPLFPIAIVVASVLATPAHAERVRVDAPAGSAGEAAIAIARQTGTSIVIGDAQIARRKVGRIRGTMDSAEAVRRLADAAGGRARPVGPSAWRIVEAPRTARARTPSRRAPSVAPAAPAAPPPTVEAEDIVVIASKRDTRRSEFSGQVSLLDGESLEFGGIGGTEKITQRVATVSSTYLGSGRNKLFIRGIADSSFTGPTQATVGQYLGDLRLSYNAPDPDLRLSDLERVEVLEGPQGTLYGAGSLGGIIRLVPNAPQMGETSLSGIVGADLTQHGEPGADASATFNLPLVRDDAALRVTLDAASQGGYIDKPLLDRDDVNRTTILSGRAIARAELGPDWSVEVIGLGQSTHAADSQYAARDGDPLESLAHVREGSDADYAHGQFVLDGKIGAVNLRSTTGIAWQDLHERYDATAPDGDPRVFAQHNDTRMIANETRLWQPLGARFGWLAGISFTDNRTRLTRSIGAPERQMRTTGVLNTVSEITGYGEASLRLTDALIATAGARLTRSSLGGSGEDVLPALALARAEVTASRTETAFLPSASLLAKVAPETSLYLRYQEGFRPGGLAVEGDFVRRFRSDHAATFEFGARHGTPGSGPFDLAISLSHTRWRDIQADFVDDFGLPSTANIGDGRVWTASASGSVRIVPELRMSGGLTYNDSRVDEPPFALLARTTHVPNIAGFAARLGLDYRRPLDGDLELTAHGWASYIGKSRLGIGPELGDLQGDYLDSGVTVRVGRDALGLTLSVTNLADVKGNRFALGTPFALGRDQITPLPPRTIRLGIDAAF